VVIEGKGGIEGFEVLLEGEARAYNLDCIDLIG
jgi:hypothetical protein